MGVATIERNVDLQTLRAGYLGKRSELDGQECIAQQERHFVAVDHRYARSGIEIENDCGGEPNLRDAMEEWMQLDASDIDDPGERPDVLHDDVLDL